MVKEGNHSIVIVKIVLAQFFCTSLWFATNGVMEELVEHFQLPSTALANLSSAVQFGFISGTLVFAMLALADRYSPSKVFWYSALAAALFNFLVCFNFNTFYSLITFRFITGFFLAGIYPVGMKIAADYHQKGLSKSLGFLVGALVLGTAFPHALKAFELSFSWQLVLILTALLAIVGGAVVGFGVPNGPYRKQGQAIRLSSFSAIFKQKNFRAAAFGYFGHMWELYAFWVFVPLILQAYQTLHPEAEFSVALWSFIIIASGTPSCILGGYLAQRYGEKRMAFFFLAGSFVCCLSLAFFFQYTSTVTFLSFLILWGMLVIADSPLFSTLVAKNAVPEMKGTALTIVNCIGFALTIVSIQLIAYFNQFYTGASIYLLLGLGPLVGLISLARKND